MERMNGKVRDREKIMRRIKKMGTPILRGYQLYHNYFREHEGLEGKKDTRRGCKHQDRRTEQMDNGNPERKIRCSYQLEVTIEF